MGITERIREHATELVVANNRSLAAALVISILLHAGAIALFLATARPAAAISESGGGTRDTILWIPSGPDIPLEPLEPAKPIEPNRPAGSDRTIGGTAKPQRAVDNAKPLVVDDATADATEYPTTREIGRAGTRGTADGDLNGGGDGSGGERLDAGQRDGTRPPIAADTALDATEIFYDNVELPTVSMEELMGRIVYPEIARQHDMEGTVYVKALIGVDGIPERVEVGSSVNRILDAAALDAVRATRFGAGRQNRQPVRVWIMIPIRFTLD